MVIWARKPRPSWRSRLLHFGEGLLLPLLAGRLGGYSGCAWGLIGAVGAGIVWEIATPLLAGPLGWSWPHADLAEALAWIVGAAIGAGVWIWRNSMRGNV